MKNIFKIGVCILLTIGSSYKGEVQAQDKEHQKFDLELNYGGAYSNSLFGFGYRNIKPNRIGTYAAIALNYHLSDKASIGFSFAVQNHSKTVKNYREDQILFILKLEDYTLYNKTHFYDVTYKRKIGKYISAIGGLGFLKPNVNVFARASSNELETSTFEEKHYGPPDYVWYGVKPRADEFVLIGGLNATYPINKRIIVGISSLLKYSLAGIESLSLSPNIKINF